MNVEEAIETARNTLGFNTLKEKQIEAIKAFLSGKDVYLHLCQLAMENQSSLKADECFLRLEVW